MLQVVVVLVVCTSGFDHVGGGDGGVDGGDEGGGGCGGGDSGSGCDIVVIRRGY